MKEVIMYNQTNLWYTDIFSVYRNVLITKLGITKTERKMVSKDNLCRIYRKSKPSVNFTQQAGELSINDSLICNIDIDIQAGDEIHVIRGYKIRKNLDISEIYIAGQPVNYYMPAGGVNVDMEHKEVGLQNTLRTGAYIENAENTHE